MNSGLRCVSSVLLALGLAVQAQNPGGQPQTGADGGKTVWYQQGNARVDVVTDADGKLAKMVVTVSTYNADGLFVGYEVVSLTPASLAVVDSATILTAVRALLANPSLVVSTGGVPPDPAAAAGVLGPLALHTSSREAGTRVGTSENFQVTTTQYAPDGTTTATSTETRSIDATPAGAREAGTTGTATGIVLGWVAVSSPTFVSGSF